MTRRTSLAPFTASLTRNTEKASQSYRIEARTMAEFCEKVQAVLDSFDGLRAVPVDCEARIPSGTHQNDVVTVIENRLAALTAALEQASRELHTTNSHWKNVAGKDVDLSQERAIYQDAYGTWVPASFEDCSQPSCVQARDLIRGNNE